MARGRQRVRLEDGLKLNINKLIRDGFGRTGERRKRSIQWSYVGTGEVIASGALEMDLEVEDYARAVLKLGRLEQYLRLKREPRRFGGGQWYFVCPSTGRLASVLWLPPGASRFCSREAWGRRRVAYGSQFLAPHDRALSRAQRIRVRLGGSDYVSLDEVDPPKPKGMRWRTYDRLVAKCQSSETICNLRLAYFVERLKRYER